MRRLLQSYYDVCTVTKQEPLRLMVNFPEGLDESLGLEIAGGSMRGMLVRIGLWSGAFPEQNQSVLIIGL